MAPGRTRQRKPLADKVYHALHARIVNGDYPAETRLPPEIQLAEEFGVSRPVLRAALERLRDEGMILSLRGIGSFVSPGAQMPPLGFARMETLADIQRCYEFRMNLEIHAAALAAERRDARILAEMAAALGQIRSATGSVEHREDVDFAFHDCIAQASNNDYFMATFRALRDHVNIAMKLHGDMLMNDGHKALEEVLEEHSVIFEAISRRDPEAARAGMKRHLERSRDRLFGGAQLDLRLA